MDAHHHLGFKRIGVCAAPRRDLRGRVACACDLGGTAPSSAVRATGGLAGTVPAA
ncbi:MAG: hypothetical protein OXE85_05865 [Roseovarius sp.]|nr:hypothetical protein [Roseovarius sp.]